MSYHETLRRALRGTTWFVYEPKMRELLAFFELRLNGGRADAETLERFRAENDLRMARAQNVSASSKGSVAVIPVYGVICHRADLFSDYSGGTSTEKLSQQINQAIADPNVKAIVMDFDTPGGSTDGVEELAGEIYAARKKKSITAVSNCLCASAGYYLASQCSEVVVSPSSMTGSIGVYLEHDDYSGALDQAGVKVTFISFGENKTEGNSAQPLSDSAFQHYQEMVDTFGAMFEKAVARGRGVTQDEVHKKFGQGRVWDAKQAVKLGLADRVGTLDDVLGQYGVTRGQGASARADVQSPAPRASVSADDADEPETQPCACACVPCQGGNCSACNCQGCDAEGCAAEDCACGQGDPETKKKAHAARARRLALAGI